MAALDELREAIRIRTQQLLWGNNRAAPELRAEVETALNDKWGWETESRNQSAADLLSYRLALNIPFDWTRAEALALKELLLDGDEWDEAVGEILGKED